LWAIDEDDATYGTVDIDIDKGNNLYFQSNFSQTVDFDPGPGTHSLTASGTEIYICKFDSLGNFLIVNHFGSGSGYGATVMGIAVDTKLNVFTTGIFQGTLDFDPSASVYDLTSYAAVNKYDLYLSRLCGSEFAVDVEERSVANKWVIYPNPSSGVFMMESDELSFAKKTIEIRSVLGEVVYRSEFEGTHSTIDLERFGRGTYFLSVCSAGKVMVKKLVID
jgi:hypothetical protein